MVSAACVLPPASEGESSHSLFPAGKPRFMSRGTNAGISLWEYPGHYLSSPGIHSTTAGPLPSPKAPLSHGEACCVHGAKRRVTDNPSESWPENGRRAELLLGCTLEGWPLHFTSTLGHPAPATRSGQLVTAGEGCRRATLAEIRGG